MIFYSRKTKNIERKDRRLWMKSYRSRFCCVFDDLGGDHGVEGVVGKGEGAGGGLEAARIALPKVAESVDVDVHREHVGPGRNDAAGTAAGIQDKRLVAHEGADDAEPASLPIALEPDTAVVGS